MIVFLKPVSHKKGTMCTQHRLIYPIQSTRVCVLVWKSKRGNTMLCNVCNITILTLIKDWENGIVFWCEFMNRKSKLSWKQPCLCAILPCHKFSIVIVSVCTTLPIPHNIQNIVLQWSFQEMLVYMVQELTKMTMLMVWCWRNFPFRC